MKNKKIETGKRKGWIYFARSPFGIDPGKRLPAYVRMVRNLSPLETLSLFDFTSFPSLHSTPRPGLSSEITLPDRSTVSTLGTHPRSPIRPFMPSFVGFIDRARGFRWNIHVEDQTFPPNPFFTLFSISLSLSLFLFPFSPFLCLFSMVFRCYENICYALDWPANGFVVYNHSSLNVVEVNAAK